MPIRTQTMRDYALHYDTWGEEGDIKKMGHFERIRHRNARIDEDIVTESRKTQNSADQDQRTGRKGNMEEMQHIRGIPDREEEKRKQQKQQQVGQSPENIWGGWWWWWGGGKKTSFL